MQQTLATLAAALLLTACAHQRPAPPQILPSPAQLAAANRAGLDAAQLGGLLNKPLYQMQPAELGRFLAWQQLDEPDLRRRIAALARKNIGQPYELFLLGEFPYETHDSQPLFNLAKSDCVVFAEHVYAMALSASCGDTASIASSASVTAAATTSTTFCSASVRAPDDGSSPPKYLPIIAATREARLPKPLASSAW